MERVVVREDKRTMAEARTTMDSSSRVEAMAAARMTMVVNVVRNTTDRKDSKVDMVVVRIIMAVDSKVDMVEDRIVTAEDSKTTALKVDAQEEETFLRAESKSFTQRLLHKS